MRFICAFFISAFSCVLVAQDSLPTQDEDYYKQFQDLENGELRSFFFFNTPKFGNF